MPDTQTFDAIVIGAGPGGYVCAIRLAQLGFNVAICEKEATLGGTCLNVGCIPSKALLDSSEHFHNAKHHFADHGILVSEPKVDMAAFIGRKTKVVDQVTKGVAFLMKKNKITVVTGTASFASQSTLEVKAPGGEVTHVLTAPRIVIATGSKVADLPGVVVDGERVITSTEALLLTEVPKTMVVIGGGIIGLELGSVYGRLGSQVTVVEYADRLIPGMDADLGKEMARILKKHLGFEFFFGHAVTSATTTGKGKARKTVVTAKKVADGAEVSFEADYTLLAVGRSPYTAGLNLAAAGLATDAKGRIDINDHFQTAVPGIYAIGDVVRGAMLAHKASDEGVWLAEHLAGHKPAPIHYHRIPGVVYTWPEVAGVGYTEDELKAAGTPYKAGKYPFKPHGRSVASGDTDGFVKILAHAETDEVLGVHMIGPRIADLIAEAVVALEFRASAEDIATFSHAHPTYAEAVKEAALDATDKRALHL